MTRRKKAERPVTAAPESILPLTDFREDVWGDDNPVAFKAGILSAPIPSEFAQRFRDDGKAAKPASDKPAKQSQD